MRDPKEGDHVLVQYDRWRGVAVVKYIHAPNYLVKMLNAETTSELVLQRESFVPLVSLFDV